MVLHNECFYFLYMDTFTTLIEEIVFALKCFDIVVSLLILGGSEDFRNKAQIYIKTEAAMQMICK